MRQSFPSLFRYCLIVAAMLSRTVAASDGAVLSLDALSDADRQALVAGIESARSQGPEAFARVRAALNFQLETSRRSRLASAPSMRSLDFLGPSALFPLLELAAVDGPDEDGLSSLESKHLKHCLIDSIGRLRDPRALPLLEAVLRGDEHDSALQQTAAIAIAHLESDKAADVLLSILDDPSESESRREAVLYGLGFCARARVALRLADLLSAQPGQETAIVIIDSLRLVGTRELWSTPGRHTEEENVVRTVAAEAVLAAFLAYDEDQVRHRAKMALRQVGDLSFVRLIEAQKKSAVNPDEVAALEELEASCIVFWTRPHAGR